MNAAPISLKTPTARLGRNLFGFALLAALFSMITWVGLLLSPPSPQPAYEQARIALIAAFTLLQAAAAGACVWAFRASEIALEQAAEYISFPLRAWPSAVGVLLALVIFNLALGPALRDVAPALTGPFRFLAAGWSFIVVLAAAVLHWERIYSLGRATLTLWASVGFLLTAAVIFAVLAAAVTALVERSGINDQLRGGFDYRELAFIDDGSAPSSAEFWREQSRTRVRWQPYVYWVVDTFEGQFINVAPNGLRQTYTPPNVPDDAPIVAFFGGSTAWGEGARDRYTIPSQLAELLNTAGTPTRVINYGQTGYVSMQDVITFQLLLAKGQAPNIAVFYGGFNDVLSAYDQKMAGLTLQESQRIADSETGRLLRTGRPVLQPLTVDLTSRDLSLAAVTSSATPDAIVTRYLANARLAARIGAAYDVKVLFVWQPSLAFKQNLVGGEKTAYAAMLERRPNFDEFYRAAHSAFVQQTTNADDLPSFLLLHDLFDGDERAIFYDIIHITELGNRTVAERIAADLAQRFSQELQADAPDS